MFVSPSITYQSADKIFFGDKSLEEHIQDEIAENMDFGAISNTGERGDTGEVGEKGDTGPTGATGDPGDLSSYLTSANAAATYELLLSSPGTNPATKFLNGNKEWETIAIGGGGYSANLYFTTQASDIPGYSVVSYTSQATEVETTTTISNTEVLARTYLFSAPVGITTYDAGVWIANYRCKVSKPTGVTNIRMEIFRRSTEGTETVLWSEYSPDINNEAYETIRSETNQPVFSMDATDRLGARIYLKTTANNITINTIIGGARSSYFTTPLRIRHNQLRSYNEDPAYQHINAADRTLLTDLLAGSLSTNYSTPTDLLLVTGANKTLVLDTAVWDDLFIDSNSLNLSGTADPLLVNYQPTGTGLITKLYEFEEADTLYFQVKLPHEYEEGSDIYAHLHWTPGGRGVAESGNIVGWEIDYSWSNIDGTFPAMAALDVSDTTDGTNDKHQKTPEVLISGANKDMDSILLGYVTRSATGDTWASTTSGQLPMLLGVSFHYQKDTLGSRDRNTK